MAIAFVQSAGSIYAPNVPSAGFAGCDIALTPAAGNTVLICAMQLSTDDPPILPAGFSVLTFRTNPDNHPSAMRWMGVAAKIAAGTETSFLVYTPGGGSLAPVVVAEFSGLGLPVLDAMTDLETFADPLPWPSPAGMASGVERLMLLLGGWDGGAVSIMPGAPVATIGDQTTSGVVRRLVVGYRVVDPAAPPYTYSVTPVGTGGKIVMHAAVAAAATRAAFPPRFW